MALGHAHIDASARSAAVLRGFGRLLLDFRDGGLVILVRGLIGHRHVVLTGVQEIVDRLIGHCRCIGVLLLTPIVLLGSKLLGELGELRRNRIGGGRRLINATTGRCRLGHAAGRCYSGIYRRHIDICRHLAGIHN